jgi:superfamily I DNA and RNA helicase
MSPPSELFGQQGDGRPRVPDLSNEPGSPHRDIVLPVCYRNTPWALTIAHALGFGIYRDGGLVQFFDDPHLWSDIGYEVVAGDMTPGHRLELRRSRESYPGYFSELLDPEDAVQHRTFDNAEDQAHWLAESIHKNLTEDELEFRDILVIISNPVTAAKKAATIIRHLEERSIPAHLAGVTTSRDVLFDEDSVAISSIYRAKGNEAPMVYLLDSDYCYSGLELIKRRNILFTAMTRSRAWVRLAGCGEKMDHLAEEVNAVVASNYSLRFKVPTGPELENMRKIHRDMSKKERDRAQRLEQSLESFAELAERGDLSLDQLPPELRERLKSLFAKK